MDEQKKRALKLIGVGVLIVGIILLVIINIRRAKTTPPGTPVSDAHVTQDPAIPTRMPDWMPREGQEINEQNIPPNTIVIYNYAYHPATLTISSGATIRIINLDEAAHSVSSGAKLFDTGLLEQHDEGVLTFTNTGSYSYYCRRHPAMQGTIVVTP